MLIDLNDCEERDLGAAEHQIKSRILEQAAELGPLATAFVRALWTDSILGAAEQARRLFNLARGYETQRLEAACKRALFYKQLDYLTLDRILREKLDALPLNPYTDINGRLSPWPPIGRIAL